MLDADRQAHIAANCIPSAPLLQNERLLHVREFRRLHSLPLLPQPWNRRGKLYTKRSRLRGADQYYVV